MKLTLTTTLWTVIILGIIVATLITGYHLLIGAHASYDNWLLPVFLAMALQLYNGH